MGFPQSAGQTPAGLGQGGLMGGLASLFSQQPGLLMQQGSPLAGMTPGMISSNQSSTGGPPSPGAQGLLQSPPGYQKYAGPMMQAGQAMGQSQGQIPKDIGQGMQLLSSLAMLAML